MATVLLQTVGAAIGSAIGGPVGAIAGRAAGALAGSAIDNSLLSEDQVVQGPRLEGTQVLSSIEGAAIPRIYGRNKLAGQIIWATHFEEVQSSTSAGGGKGSQPTTTTVSYSYFANFAIGISEGPVSLLRRIWADGEALDLSTINYRFYNGDSTQQPDPLIEAKQGVGNAPAYRGTSYIVFDSFPLAQFGNRIPQLTFEVVRSIGALEQQIRTITVIPGSTEYGYDTDLVSTGGGEWPYNAQNRHQTIATTDWEASIDELQALCPNLERVALVIAWFGNDLRAGECQLLPGTTDHFHANWSVGPYLRHTARLISQVDGRPAFGGTPDDGSILRAIADLKRRGLKVVLYPFIMMDIPADNTLPGMNGNGHQPPYPWRGEISCYPQPGASGSTDQTNAAATQINAFSSRYVTFINHYISLGVQAGGIDGFLIGSELRSLTRVRDGSGNFPFVETLNALAVSAKSSLGQNCLVTYGADWSEYFGYQPPDGSGDVLFNLDPLWAHPSIDAVGIDNYMPLADMRNGREPEIDRVLSPYNLDTLQRHIEGEEGFDWYYRSHEERMSGVRTPITDGLGEPWIYRYKDLRSWWSNPHYNRYGGTRDEVPTEWQPQSKPFFLTELGCPAIDHGANEPNVFFDPKSAQSALPRFSSGVRDDLIQRRFLQAHFNYWDTEENNPVSSLYNGRMVTTEQIAPWAWDARPFPWFPLDLNTWSDGENWNRGHWLNGRLGASALDDLVRAIFDDYELAAPNLQLDGLLDGYVIPSQASVRQTLEPLLGLFNAFAIEAGGELVFSQSLFSEIVTVSEDQLVQEEGQIRKSVRRQAELELPAEAMITHTTVFGEFEQTSTKSRRLNGGSDRQISIQVPAVIQEEVALNLANVRLRNDWYGRQFCDLSLPTEFINIGPGDRLSFLDDPENTQWLVISSEKGIHQQLQLRSVFDDHQLRAGSTVSYRQPAQGEDFGQPFVLMMNLPALSEEDLDKVVSYAAIYAEPWSGEYHLHRSATTTGFTFHDTAIQRSVVGELLTELPPGPSGRIDYAHTIHTRLLRGQLQSLEPMDLFNGRNVLAVETSNGEFEIIQFLDADMQHDGTWKLSRLLRAQLGTERESSAGALIGARLVLLDNAVTPVRLRPEDLGLEYNWRVGPAQKPLAGEAYTGLTHTSTGRIFEMLSPVHLKVTNAAEGSEVSWIRRGRKNSDSWEVTEIPLDAGIERYRIRVRDLSGDIVREIDVNEAVYVYLDMDRLNELGALDIGCLFEIAQLNDLGEPGNFSQISHP